MKFFQAIMIVCGGLFASAALADDLLMSACPKEIKVRLISASDDIAVPEHTMITAIGVYNLKRTSVAYALGRRLGEAHFSKGDGHFPSTVVVPISSVKECPNLIMLDLQGAPEKWFGFHFANSSPSIHGKAFSALGNEVAIIINKVRSSF